MRDLLRVLLVLLLCPGAAGACEARPRAVVRLDIVGTTILVPVLVNGIAGRFILDTGAEFSVVTPDAVRHFNLALDEWTATTMRGVGGVERRRNADPRSVTLGGVALHRRSLARDSTLRVATLPSMVVAGRQIDGLLGRDFLSAFDLDLNFPARELTLYEVRDCAGRFLPWTEPHLSIPVENPTDSAMEVPVELDGVPLHALLDTGAGRTLVAAPGMARLGLSLDRLRTDPSRVISGLGLHTVTVWQHKFATFKIGGETFPAPRFPVTPIELTPFADLLLGADWLIGRRVWISYATNQLFVTQQEQ